MAKPLDHRKACLEEEIYTGLVNVMNLIVKQYIYNFEILFTESNHK